MKRTLLLILAFLFLFALEILRVYFIMPFPGSQRSNTLQVAYFIGKYIWWLRLLGLLLLLPLLWRAFRSGKWWKKILLGFFILLYGGVFYLVNFKFLADKMFYQPQQKILVSATENKVDSNKLIIGVSVNGEAKAYPIEIIGYHHQVQDTIGGRPVMITYCTVCRTGRVFSPFVHGKFQHFRLVGMDHFNAMFEDEDTKSWWRQATGEAVAGKLKGTKLDEIPSKQMRLGTWLQQYPGSLVMQPDPAFQKQYKGLEGFDAGTIRSGLEKRDSASWKFKSWVIGVVVGEHTRAYDWNALAEQRFIQDTLNGTPIVLLLDNDGQSFHVWNRRHNFKLLQFELDKTSGLMKEATSNSIWNMKGECMEGILKGEHLVPVAAYQEFWHSWQQFHPKTTVFPVK